jgi:hypothetical protein
MADIALDTQGAPATPSANTGVLYLDSTSKELVNIDDTGAKKTVRTLVNANTADLTPAAATDTYLAGSAIKVPPGLVRVATTFTWTFAMTKTGAGVAQPIWTVRVGTAGTTADTARLTFTGSAQTAAVDTGYAQIQVVVRLGGATGVIEGFYTLGHVLAATGFASIGTDVQQATSAAFDTTVANVFYGISLNTGAAAAWTIPHVSAQADGL